MDWDRAARRAAFVPLLCLVAFVVAVLGFAASASADEMPSDDPAADAETARAAGLFERCIDKDRAAIERDPKPTTRVHLAGCADRTNQVLLALEQLRIVLDDAIASDDAELAELARERVIQLLKRLAAITLDPPPQAADLVVRVDGTVLAPEQLGRPLAVNPGAHRIHAEGVLDGVLAVYDEIASLADGERRTIEIALAPRAAEHLTPGQIACMQEAKTDQEAFRCLPAQNKPLVVRAAAEMSIYRDSFDVTVLNPLVRANVASPTKGWTVGASYLVDIISAASPDFVSTASPTGHDTRHAALVNGSYKPGRFGAEAEAGISTEADYLSKNAGLAVLGDFFDKRVTPRLAWNLSYDWIGRGGTPYDVFHHTFVTNEGQLGSSFVLSPRTVVVVGVTAGFERGDQSKPYRLIPMFAAGVDVPAGASADVVNAVRLPVRPYEQLPLERDRTAIGLRLIRRIGQTTLRLDERLYDDTWQNRATTTDARWLIDASSRVTVGPHVRFHWQTGTSFFERVYHAELAPSVVVPSFRTTDRELGPFYAFTGGGSVWWKLSTEDEGSIGWLLYASGDVLHDVYTNSLYVGSRTAGYGTVGIEAVFE
jgi:hypothetical protein